MAEPNTFDLLKQRFMALMQGFDPTLSEKYWLEIVKSYTAKNRFYHNLDHLWQVLVELDQAQHLLHNKETVEWSVFYHDIVYRVRKNDNEEQSAALAVKRLKSLNMAESRISQCEAQIIATKSHSIALENDTNLMTDADLAVLGKDWDSYQNYFKAIRKEYRIYPNILYKPGRKKVLTHFLEMPFIFKTSHFQKLYEQQARVNMSRELEVLVVS